MISTGTWISKFRYIYPPRPENKISVASLSTFESMSCFLAQPKLNGSLMEIYMDEENIYLWNRHKEPIHCKMDVNELRKLYRGSGLMVLCGEYMNKSKKDESGETWNQKYVIFDMIVYNGKHLTGTTFEERFTMLKSLYPDNPVKLYMHQITENCFRVESFYKDFEKIYEEITKFDMYEGEVLKSKDAKLEDGTTAGNNVKSQIKCRKPTKNYNF